MAGWTKIPLGMEVGLGPGDFAWMGTQLPRKKGTTPPNFWPMPIVAKQLDVWMYQDATWYRGKPRPRDVVLDGVAAPPKRGTAPQFSVHAYCGQTAGWMKTPLLGDCFNAAKLIS